MKLFLTLLFLIFSPFIFASTVYLQEPQVYTSQEVYTYRQQLADNLNHVEGVQVVQVGDTLKVILSVDRFFKEQSNTRIRVAKIPALEEIAALFRTYKYRRIIVSGHTDEVGSDESKFFRSGQQANTIAGYLWSNGIPLSSITVLACADTKPVSSNKILEGSAANRRIEIELAASNRPRYYK